MATYAPPTKRPNVRTDRARANDFDIYGYAVKRGQHYVAVAPKDGSYYLLPEHPANVYDAFRHVFVRVRRLRPHVIVIEGLR